MALTRLLFIGMPGAGKGTQAKLLNLNYIGTGDIIRKAILNKDPLFLEYQGTMKKGELLPDEFICKLVEQEIDKLPNNSGYILDGATRTVEQAKFVLEKELIDATLEFYLPEKEARRRIEIRRTEENREEDSPEAVDKRFKEYYEKTFFTNIFLIQQSYKNKIPKHFVIHAINSLGEAKSIDEVHKDILKKIDYSLA